MSRARLDEEFHRGQVEPHSGIKIRFLGTAGFVIEGADRKLVIDPYLTRPKFFTFFFGRVPPDEALIKKVIPAADDVLVGHAHLDHALDAPPLCKMTGARLIGSRSVCNLGRGYGLPESQLVETQGGDEIRSGSATIRSLPSEHSLILGRVPFAGSVEKPPRWPARVGKFRVGQVLDWHIEIAGTKIVHIDSAAYRAGAFKGLQADVLCLCERGWKRFPDYTRKAIEMLNPSVVIPCHWDNFFRPYHHTPRLLPGSDIHGFLREIRACGAKAVLLPTNGQFGFTMGG